MNLLNANRERIQSGMLSQVYGSHRRGNRKIIVQGATGVGKTWVGGRIVKGTLSRGGKALVVTHRRKLTKQMHKIMHLLGMEPSYLMAGEAFNRNAPLQVACEATLKGRLRRARGACSINHLLPFNLQNSITDILPPADTIIVDECHVGDIKWLTEIYPNSVFIGLTATPIKSDGSGLGDQYDDLILGPSIRELIELGMLLPADVRNSEGVILPDGSAEDEVKLLGKVVENWKINAYGKRTVVYAKSVLHSQHLCEQFNAAGIKAEHIDSSVSDEPGEDGISERERIYQRLASGEIKVVSNYGIVVEGVDIPEIECVVLARPNKDKVMGLITYLQAIGRARRPFGDQRSVLVLDHTRTSEQDDTCFSKSLGHPDQDWPWELNNTKKQTIERLQSRAKKAKEEAENATKKDKLIRCECGASYSPAPKCPACGMDTPPRTHIVEEVPILLGKSGTAKLDWNRKVVTTLYRELMGYYQSKKAPKWLARTVGLAHEKIPQEFRLSWREIERLEPMEPSAETKKMALNSLKQYHLLQKKGYTKGKSKNSSISV